MQITQRTHAAIRRAVNLLGGVTKTAAATGTDASIVSRCFNGKRRAPFKFAIALSHATDGAVKASEIRPELAKMETGR